MTHTATDRPAARASGALVPVLAFMGIVVSVMQALLVPVIKELATARAPVRPSCLGAGGVAALRTRLGGVRALHPRTTPTEPSTRQSGCLAWSRVTSLAPIQHVPVP
jgi:hypothetical protein